MFHLSYVINVLIYQLTSDSLREKNIASNHNICKCQTVSTLCVSLSLFFSIYFLSTGLQWGATNLWLGCQRQSTLRKEDSIMFHQIQHHSSWNVIYRNNSLCMEPSVPIENLRSLELKVNVLLNKILFIITSCTKLLLNLSYTQTVSVVIIFFLHFLWRHIPLKRIIRTLLVLKSIFN